jgi:hypothetical protein
VCDVVVTSGRVTGPQAAMYAGLLCSQALGACWQRQVWKVRASGDGSHDGGRAEKELQGEQ